MKAMDLQVGDRVNHPVFGVGEVSYFVHRNGEDDLISVKFSDKSRSFCVTTEKLRKIK